MASVYKPNPSIPLFIWLQGGPGSSSAFGAHTEIGPIKIKNGEVSENDYSWNILGHTLFIDSPLNTGFSYSGDRTGDKQVSSTNEATDHLVNFLTNFYSTWPALLQSPLYITGESFAGHYIPVLARKLIEDRPVNVTVAGIAIGNGWTDPINQINFMDSYLWSVGVIDRGFRDTCNWFQTSAVLSIDNADYKKVHFEINAGY
jgi:carboxypeptidase C (cathepsin A)